MLILLPDSVDGLPALERSLTAGNLEKWSAALNYEHDVVVYLPRFKITQQFELSSALKDLGVKTAFDGNSADFSGMTGDKSLVISAAIHKAYIDVDENGTEAAAATAVVMGWPRPCNPGPLRRAHLLHRRPSLPVPHPGQHKRSHPLHGPHHRPDKMTNSKCTKFAGGAHAMNFD